MEKDIRELVNICEQELLSKVPLNLERLLFYAHF